MLQKNGGRMYKKQKKAKEKAIFTKIITKNKVIYVKLHKNSFNFDILML